MVPHFSLRISPEKLNKIKYIAEYNGQSANKEIASAIIRHIRKFEQQHGPIVLDD